MVLDGEFSYDDQNQRALPFNVAIQELSEEMTLYVGSKSKSTIFFSITNLNLSQKYNIPSTFGVCKVHVIV